MLRLLPKTVVIGLFPDHCWLRIGKKSERREASAEGDTKTLLRELYSMLEDAGKEIGRFTYAEVYVSDRYSRAMLVPWQSALDSDEQTVGYGRACLETNGSLADGDWAVHCGFRHHGMPGFATALPMDLMRQIQDALMARGIRLRAVMPVSAAAYWYHNTERKAGMSVLLLEEAKRLSTFAYSRGKLISTDVEPILTSANDAVQRLANRLRVAHGDLQRIQHWRSALDLPEGAALSIDGAEMTPVVRARWSFR